MKSAYANFFFISYTFEANILPHNDICPYGRTYPKKAVAIIKIKITVPIVHTRVLGAL